MRGAGLPLLACMYVYMYRSRRRRGKGWAGSWEVSPSERLVSQHACVFFGGGGLMADSV